MSACLLKLARRWFISWLVFGGLWLLLFVFQPSPSASALLFFNGVQSSGCVLKDIDQKEYFWSMMFFSDHTLLPR